MELTKSKMNCNWRKITKSKKKINCRKIERVRGKRKRLKRKKLMFWNMQNMRPKQKQNNQTNLMLNKSKMISKLNMKSLSMRLHLSLPKK